MAYHKKNSRWLSILCLLVMLVGCTPATPSRNEDSSSSSSEITPSPGVGTDDWFMDETKRSDPAYLEEMYNYGFLLIGNQYYQTAISLYTFLGDYKDSPARLAEAMRLYDLYTTTDLPLTVDGEEFFIINREGDYVLLRRRASLPAAPYHHTDCHVTWADCSLRAQLQDYYEKTFTRETKARIRPTVNEGATDYVFIRALGEEMIQSIGGMGPCAQEWLRCETEYRNGKWIGLGKPDNDYGEYCPTELLDVFPVFWYYYPIAESPRNNTPSFARNMDEIPDIPWRVIDQIEKRPAYTMSYEEYFSRERERMPLNIQMDCSGHAEKYGCSVFSVYSLWIKLSHLTCEGVVVSNAENELLLVSFDMTSAQVLGRTEYPVRWFTGDAVVIYYADGADVYRLHIPSKRIDHITTIEQADPVRNELRVFTPLSNTDIGISYTLPGTYVKNYLGPGVGRAEIYGGVYSTLTDTFYPVDIYDAFPDFSSYFEEREADIVRMGLDPDALLYYREHER